MAIPDKLREYADWFNDNACYWTFTKARAVRTSILNEIVSYHVLLRRDFILDNKSWNPESQIRFANTIKQGSNAAWARELKTLFNLLGSAWVENDEVIKLTEVGWKLLNSANPQRLLESQVRKYQLGNPQTSKKLTENITVVPHFVLLELLVNSYPIPLAKEEFVIFVSRIFSHDQIGYFEELLREYRSLSDSDKNEFSNLLGGELTRKIERVFSYAANFLSFPQYLEYKNTQISITHLTDAKRVVTWYKQGNNTYIKFNSLKDWFSHYGRSDTSANPLIAADYYRSIGEVDQSIAAYSIAIEKGIAPLEDTAEDYSCRVNGEAKLEAWLLDNLGRLEEGLVFIGNQYETNEAGRIDILAKDVDSKYVVIELKRDKASDVALGQLLRYIGWVRMNLAEGGYVRGFVIGDTIDERMIYAILAHDELDEICKLKQYQDLGIRLRIERSEGDCYAEIEELL